MLINITCMVRLGLISNHIVLTENISSESISYPRSGIILIQDERIYDVILLKEPELLSSLFDRYSDWNPIDYSEFYISPGIIDLSVRTEWESISELTKQALEGGVTLVVAEEGHYIRTENSSPAFCDVIKLEVINETSISEKKKNKLEDSVLKAYLFPPAPNVKSVSHLQHIIQRAEKLGKTLFIDATLPDPRMLYMASPLRLEEPDNREHAERANFASFASAFHQDSKASSEEEKESEDSEDSDEEKLSLLKSGSLPVGPNKSNKIISSQEECKELDLAKSAKISHEEKKISRKRASDIFDDLDLRIANSQQLHEDLIKAEASTYSQSGSTSYDGPKKTHSSSLLISKEDLSIPSLSPQSSSPSPTSSFMSRFSTRIATLKIQPLVTKSPNLNENLCDYNHHLANYPVSWETDGVNKVLELLSPNSKVHFTGLSSAPAINLIRKAKKTLKKITCEISSVSLCFNSNCVAAGDTRFKNSPPVRNISNNNLLWDLLKMKAIDCITSSHASIQVHKKKTSNFQTALNGIATIGCTLQSVWYIINKPVVYASILEHYIVRLAKWLSLHPAEVLGVQKNRGSIFPGKYADLVIWKPREKYRLDHQYAYFETSPFVGQELLGKVHKVYVRGELAYEIPPPDMEFKIVLNLNNK